jgi:hypothetical protein
MDSQELLGNIYASLSNTQHYVGQLEVKLYELQDAIRHIRDQRGDDRCWKDWEDVYKLLPEGYFPRKMDTTVELKNCEQYIKSCNDPNTTYISPQRRIEELEAEVASLKRDLNKTDREILAQYILEGLSRQSFVDWYQSEFLQWIEDAYSMEAVGHGEDYILKQIVKIFRLNR